MEEPKQHKETLEQHLLGKKPQEQEGFFKTLSLTQIHLLIRSENPSIRALVAKSEVVFIVIPSLSEHFVHDSDKTVVFALAENKVAVGCQAIVETLLRKAIASEPYFGLIEKLKANSQATQYLSREAFQTILRETTKAITKDPVLVQKASKILFNA